MIRIKCFASSVNSDSIEGRGSQELVGYFKHEKDAKLSVKGKGVMGVGDGMVVPTELVVFESFAEFKGETRREIRQRALAKLSQEERDALGVDTNAENNAS